jgi:hypothetical protein
MSNVAICPEVTRINDNVYILDAESHLGQGLYDLGPIAKMTANEFSERWDRVVETVDARHLFGSPEERKTFDKRELAALAIYMTYDGDEGIPRELQHGDSITAREGLGDLDPGKVAMMRAARNFDIYDDDPICMAAGQALPSAS